MKQKTARDIMDSLVKIGWTEGLYDRAARTVKLTKADATIIVYSYYPNHLENCRYLAGLFSKTPVFEYKLYTAGNTGRHILLAKVESTTPINIMHLVQEHNVYLHENVQNILEFFIKNGLFKNVPFVEGKQEIAFFTHSRCTYSDYWVECKQII